MEINEEQLYSTIKDIIYIRIKPLEKQIDAQEIRLNSLDVDIKDIKDIVVETHTTMTHILTELEKGNIRFEKLEKRVRYIENLFVPVVAVIGIITYQLLDWLK